MQKAFFQALSEIEMQLSHLFRLRPEGNKFCPSLGFWLICSGLLLIPWILTTIPLALDFNVYYTAAQALMNGENPYDVARFQPTVYKYPPWCLPLFLPFAPLPTSLANATWGILNALMFLDVLRKILSKHAQTSSFWIAPLVVLLIYPLGMINAVTGQISILLLWGWWNLSWIAPNLIFSSSKIMTLLIGAFFIPRKKIGSTLISTGISIIGLMLIYRYFLPTSLSEILHQWMRAAAGGRETGLFTLNRENQGIPALILRCLRVADDPGVPKTLAFLSCGLALPMFFLWHRISKYIPLDTSRAGWLLICATLQPLAWFHTFLFAVPALVLTLIYAIENKKKVILNTALIASVCMTMITQKSLGLIGTYLELGSIKSWGAFTLCGLLVYSHFPRGTSPRTSTSPGS